MEPVRISEQPLLLAAPGHDAHISPQDVEGGDIVQAVLVKGSQGHIVKAGRYQGNLQGIKPRPQHCLIILDSHFLCTADFHQLVKELHATVPNLLVLCRICQTALTFG